MKLSLSNLPNPLDDPTGFETAYNDNCTAIEAAVENAAVRTGDVFLQSTDGPFTVSVSRVTNGTLVEGEAYEAEGPGGNPALVPDIGPFNITTANGPLTPPLQQVGYQYLGFGTLNSAGGDVAPNFLGTEDGLDLIEVIVLIPSGTFAYGDLRAKYASVTVGDLGTFAITESVTTIAPFGSLGFAWPHLTDGDWGPGENQTVTFNPA